MQVKSTSKVLIVAPGWVGDIVMAQALFKLLKQRDTQQIIDVLTLSPYCSLVERMPEVNQVLPMPIGHGKFDLLGRRALGIALRHKSYNEAIIIPSSWKSALIPFFARIPRRRGWKGEMRWGLLNQIYPLDKQQLPLVTDRFLSLGLPLGDELPPQATRPMPHLQVNQSNQLKKLGEFNLDTSRPILALCPGAAYGPAKLWPTKYFATIANEKLEQGWQVWIFGSPQEAAIAEEIQSYTHHRCINLTGNTQLGDAVDLMGLAAAVVSNDSGLMHVAVALKRPTVVLVGSSNPGFNPQGRAVRLVNLNLECSPCMQRTCRFGHYKCLQELQPALVSAALQEVS